MQAPIFLLPMSFPEHRASLRKEHGFTQQQTADKIGMHVSKLKRYESGASQPTIEVFRRIAHSILPLRGQKVLLDAEEFAALRPQSVTSNTGRGGPRYAPYAFTEQGVAMLSSPQAIAGILDAIRQLMAPSPARKKRPIGFVTGEK
jgi:transcriptional regulator with XRE-family HTH domain